MDYIEAKEEEEMEFLEVMLEIEEEEEIEEVVLTLQDANSDIDLALNRIINIPDKYIEPFMKDYMKIYLSQINCLVQDMYKQIDKKNPGVVEDIFEEQIEKFEKEVEKNRKKKER